MYVMDFVTAFDSMVRFSATHRLRTYPKRLVLGALLLALLSGCGAEPEAAPAAIGPVRTPQPTFTPTAVADTVDAPANPAPDLDTPTTATISGALVNVRAGPGVQFDIVAEVGEGELFEVVGRDDTGSWWNICCVGEGIGGSGWVIDDFARIDGPVAQFGASGTESAAQTGGPIADNASTDAPLLDEDAPIAVINAPVVNARSGPTTTFDIVTEVERGREFAIVGSNATQEWWRVCCVDGEEVWVVDEFVDTQGDLARVDGDAPNGSGGSASAGSAGPSDSTSAGTSTSADGDFTLAATERFAEPGVVRLYLYVLDDNGALPGYSLRVTHNDEPLDVDEISFGGQPSFTWPVADARQRFQNMKVEFPGVEPAGDWEVQLVDEEGNVVGPPATFELSENDDQRELYVRYERL